MFGFTVSYPDFLPHRIAKNFATKFFAIDNSLVFFGLPQEEACGRGQLLDELQQFIVGVVEGDVGVTAHHRDESVLAIDMDAEVSMVQTLRQPFHKYCRLGVLYPFVASVAINDQVVVTVQFQ